MHFSRMHTARSSSHLTGGLHTPPWQEAPPGSKHPPEAGIPLEQAPPWEQAPPRSRHPPRAGTPPGAGTPRSRHPPGSRHSPGVGTLLGAGTPPPGADPPCEQNNWQTRCKKITFANYVCRCTVIKVPHPKGRGVQFYCYKTTPLPWA